MIQKLPALYKEDMVRKQISEVCDTTIVDNQKLYKLPRCKRVFQYIDYTQRRDIRTYWFKGTQDRACCFDVEMQNPFVDMWDSYLQENTIVTVDTYMNIRHQDNFYFYYMMAPKVSV